MNKLLILIFTLFLTACMMPGSAAGEDKVGQGDVVDLTDSKPKEGVVFAVCIFAVGEDGTKYLVDHRHAENMGDCIKKRRAAKPLLGGISPHCTYSLNTRAVLSSPALTSRTSPLYRIDLGDLYAESGQTLQSSFSAVSKPNFASKYSLESSSRDLHNALLLHRFWNP